MQIGDLLIYDSRRHVVRGFDPEGVSPRMIYLEDVATGAHVAVPFERLGSHAKRGRLRLLGRPSSKERRNDLL